MKRSRKKTNPYKEKYREIEKLGKGQFGMNLCRMLITNPKYRCCHACQREIDQESIRVKEDRPQSFESKRAETSVQ